MQSRADVDLLEETIAVAERQPTTCYTYITMDFDRSITARRSINSHDWLPHEIKLPHLKIRGRG
jgi:hypothetical protein